MPKKKYKLSAYDLESFQRLERVKQAAEEIRVLSRELHVTTWERVRVNYLLNEGKNYAVDLRRGLLKEV